MVLGLQRDVLLGVGGRLAVGGGVDAEHREVACVAGPCPVVGVAAKLTHRRGRCAHQADILVDDMDEEEILVAVEHGLHRGLVVGACGSLLGDALAYVAHGLGAVGLAHVVAKAFQHTSGHILHTNQYRGGEAGVRQLLRHVVGPETVAQVVVLHGRMLLQLAVAAVVVGRDEALVGDNLASAEVRERATLVAEAHNGIFDTVLVNGIDVFGRELEASLLHVGIVLANERKQPHALVGAAGGGCQHQHRQGQGKDDFFHAINVMLLLL